MSFEKLCSPFHIGGLKLKNRMVKAPQGMGYCDKDGYITDRDMNFYESIARGGVGMICLEPLKVVPEPWGSSPVDPIGGWDDKFLPGLTELAETIHRYGTVVIPQLLHLGTRSTLNTRGASTLSKEELPMPNAPLPRGLSIEEVKETIELHVRAAERAKKAGFDGVEVHAAHGYLLNSFLSRIFNKRQDKYGPQDISSRARIVVEIIQGIKERLGADYPVGVRINGREFQAETGTTPEESCQIALLLEQAGADYISVAGYGYGKSPFMFIPDRFLYPEPSEDMMQFRKVFKNPGLFIPAAEAIKKAVSVPVIGVGNLTPELGESLLEKGKIDLVAFGRTLFADPELPLKVCSGKRKEVVPCTHCGTCISYMGYEFRRCRINAAMGEEKDYAQYNWKPVKKKKKIMVVGGGPAGMEAARVAALRGHEVSLYDKEPKLGGLLPLASMVKGLDIEDIPAITRYYDSQLTKVGVSVFLNTEVTPELVQAANPDTVILASGGILPAPEIPGINKHQVITSAELHQRVKTPLRFFGPRLLRWLTRFYLPIGKRVAVIGGALEGCEAAEFLVKRGRQVSVVEASDKLGTGIPEGFVERVAPWFAKKGVDVYTGATCESVTDYGLNVLAENGEKIYIETDSILVALPPEPNQKLFQALQGKIPEIHRVGSANGENSKLIVDAISEGRRIGCKI